MKEKRASNKLKQKQLETKYLQDQTKKMEDKLSELKKQIQQQKKMRTQLNLQSTVTRWQKATKAPQGPLKSYAKQILEEQKQAYSQFGINQKKITGTKAFEGVLKQIKQEKQIEEDRNPTKITTFLKQPQVEEKPEQKIVLQNNFFKAKMDVKKLIKQKTLEQFLQQNFIQQYIPRFKQEGFTDLESIRYIQRQKLNDMGVKAGHIVKILKKIKEQFDKLLSGKYQQKNVQKQQQKVQSGYGEGDVTEYKQLQSIQKHQEVSNIELQSQIKPPQGENYQEQEQDLVIITAPMHQFSIQVNQQQQRINCYQCYKIVANFEWHYDEKYFCCEICMEKFMVQLKKSCPACGKTFIKTQGYRQQGLWFCSLGCCPNHEQIQQMFFEWRRRRQ